MQYLGISTDWKQTLSWATFLPSKLSIYSEGSICSLQMITKFSYT